MDTDETAGDDPVHDETADETTDEVETEVEEAEVGGLAMGLPGPLGSLAPGLPGTEGGLHARKAGKDQMEYLTVTMHDVQITGTP